MNNSIISCHKKWRWNVRMGFRAPHDCNDNNRKDYRKTKQFENLKSLLYYNKILYQ